LKFDQLPNRRLSFIEGGLFNKGYKKQWEKKKKIRGGIIMKSKLGMFSILLFIFGLISYIAVLFGNDNFLFIGVILASLGFILAVFAEKGIYKAVGLFGNGIIIFITIVIPFIVTTFFWNTP
jgi:hypothetical protein